MSADFVRRDEFERRYEAFTGYVDHSINNLRNGLFREIGVSERRTQEKIDTLRSEFQAFRERHDVEMAQVHSEFAQIREVLMWMAQRLPPEPIGPPPAQFLKYDDTERA